MARFIQCSFVSVLFLAVSCELSAQAYSVSTIPNAFATHNISATGTILPGGANLDDDLESFAFPAGFTFNFYGASYSSMTVCSNGWLYFGPTQTLTQAQNRDAPASAPLPALPNNYIAGCWDDLDPLDALSGKVKVQRLSSPDRLVILWDQIGHFALAATQKAHFAIVLFAITNIIEIHYGSAQSITPGPMGAGIENSGGTVATTRPGGIGVLPTPADAFRWDPPANLPPAISVERDIATTPLGLVNTTTTIVRTGTTLANLGLRFRVTDSNPTQTLSLTALVVPSANITGFTQAQWDAGPSVVQPVTALPTTGSFNIIGDILVTLNASDGAGGSAVFTFTIRVLLPALIGTQTIRQTGVADFNSIGAAFDYIEANGISGPVVLQIMDSATYVSDASYSLGISANGQATTPVMGASAVNTITLRPAPGQTPVIQGNATGAVLYPQSVSPTLTLLNGRGGLGIMQSFVIVEGLEVNGGPHFGIIMQGNSSQGLNPSDMTIRRCRVHSITNGPGIAYMGQNSGFSTNVVIEHNFVWNCFSVAVPPAGNMLGSTLGSITIRNPASGSGSVRHNTVLHTSTVATTAGMYLSVSSAQFPLHECSNNIVVVTSPTLPALFMQQPTLVPTLANCNFNYWFAAVMSNQAGFTTFPAWQLSGRDTLGSNLDPKLQSIVGPAFDLHLQPLSPCIDPLGQTSTATIDVDGDVRPKGPRADIGADEADSPPDIEVLLNATAVTSGGMVNLGNVSLAGVQRTFTINNPALGNLVLGGTPAVQITPGANLDAATAVQTQPGLTLIPPSGTTTFTLFIDPTAMVAFNLVVTIDTNDPDEDPFAFTITGTGFHNDPAEANPAAGSSFSGPQNGPFALSLLPGDVLANATIALTDPESNVITVTQVVPPAVMPAGITAPTNPTPAHPLNLVWGGSVPANAAPGLFVWSITFRDSVDQTPVTISVSITIVDLPPTHQPALGVQGDGSAALPYRAGYTVGMTGATSRDLANFNDPNQGQVLTLSTIVDVSTLGGTGFQFFLSGGLLSVAPAGTLIAADAGAQVWTVTVTDGANPVTVTVGIQVAPAITFTTGATLPPIARSSNFAGLTINTTGGSGIVTKTIIAGALPTGLSMSLAGVVSGTTLIPAGPFSFTIRATDSFGVTAQQVYQLDVTDPAAGLPVVTSGPALPTGTNGSAYGPLTLVVSGGTAPFVFTMESGTLPPGLNLSSAGIISGTPTSLATSSFTVRVTDSSSPAVFNTTALSLAIVAPEPPDADSGSGCNAGQFAGHAGWFGLAAMSLLALRRRRK